MAALPLKFYLCPGCDQLRPISDAKKVVRQGREVVVCGKCA